MDTRTGFIPDALSIPFLAIAALYGFLTGTQPLAAALLAAVFFGFQWLLSRGRWIGSGDILLGVGIGFLMGDVPRLLLVLAFAYIAGACIAVFLLLRGRADHSRVVPLGPLLTGGTLITLVYGDRLLASVGF